MCLHVWSFGFWPSVNSKKDIYIYIHDLLFQVMGCLCNRGRKKKGKPPTAAIHRRGNRSSIQASQGGAADGITGSRDGDMVVMTNYGAAVLAATAISATADSATFVSDSGGGGGGGGEGGGCGSSGGGG